MDILTYVRPALKIIDQELISLRYRNFAVRFSVDIVWSSVLNLNNLKLHKI